MAFELFTVRLPEEYIRFVKYIAGKDQRSQGFVVQQALHALGEGALPPPRRTDAPPSDDPPPEADGDKASEQIATPGGNTEVSA